jgi:hypothetical protein
VRDDELQCDVTSLVSQSAIALRSRQEHMAPPPPLQLFAGLRFYVLPLGQSSAASFVDVRSSVISHLQKGGGQVLSRDAISSKENLGKFVVVCCNLHSRPEVPHKEVRRSACRILFPAHSRSARQCWTASGCLTASPARSCCRMTPTPWMRQRRQRRRRRRTRRPSASGCGASLSAASPPLLTHSAC